MSALPIGFPMGEASVPPLAQGGSGGEGEVKGEFLGVFEALTLGAHHPSEEEGKAPLLVPEGKAGDGGEGSGQALALLLQIINGPLILLAEGSERAPSADGAAEKKSTSPLQGEALVNLLELLKEKGLIPQTMTEGVSGAASPGEDLSPEPSRGYGSPAVEVLLRDSSRYALSLDRLPSVASLSQGIPEGAMEGSSEGDVALPSGAADERSAIGSEQVQTPKEPFPLTGGKVEALKEQPPQERAVEVKAEGVLPREPIPGRERPDPSQKGAVSEGKAPAAQPFSTHEKVTLEGKPSPKLNPPISQDKTSLLSPDPSPPPVREALEVKSIAPPEPGAGFSLQGEELEFESKGSFPEAQDGARSRAAPFAPTGEQALKAGGTEAKAAPSPFRTELQERILEQVIEKATLSINGGKREVSLRLEPETLGVVRIQMRLEEGVLSARLMAESHAVKEALEAGLPRLREALAQQGLSLEHLRVDVGDGRGSPMLFPWEGNGQGKPGVEGEDQVFEPRESQGEEDPYSPLSPESGRINIFI